MNSNFPDCSRNNETHRDRVFDDLRHRLSRETPCRKLADVLESVNAMQRARSTPEEFDLRFEEFVYRAEDYVAVVRAFFPALVFYLSSRGAARHVPSGTQRVSENGESAAQVA